MSKLKYLQYIEQKGSLTAKVSRTSTNVSE